MRIVIDLQGMQTESRFRGIGRYSLSLAKAIVKNRGSHEVVVALNGFLPETVSAIRKEFRGLLPDGGVLVWNAPEIRSERSAGESWRREAAELLRESFLASLKPDFILVTSLFEGFEGDFVGSIGSLDSSAPVAVILYDLIPLMNPSDYLNDSIVSDWYYNKVEHCRRADLILSISESARIEAIEYLDVLGSDIVNISTAANDEFLPLKLSTTRRDELKEKFKLSEEFLMYSGASDERKNHFRLISAYARLPQLVRSVHQLVFVGRLPEAHRQRFLSHAKNCGLKSGELIVCGQVADEELLDLYRLCKAFVFPSWHEGFGLPALEAMSCGRAVICSNVSSLPEVVARDDAMFDPFDEESIAGKIEQVLTDDNFRIELEQHGLSQAKNFSWDKSAQTALTAFEEIVSVGAGVGAHESADKLIDKLAAVFSAANTAAEDVAAAANCIDVNERVALQFRRLTTEISLRIEGPFDSSYSLALLNRETSLALDALGYDVTLHSTEGPGDFDPNPKFLRENPAIERLYEKSLRQVPGGSDVVSRNLYPPRVNDINGRLAFLHHYAWEESGFPQQWVESFNDHLDGMTCLSTHVQKVMIDNGVSTPMTVSGCGVDHWERVPDDGFFDLVAKDFRYLHVSSCFPRKGVDSLLKAFGDAFTNNDDVSLVIKTFPNPHNDVYQWLDKIRAERSDYPDVVIIDRDLSDVELKALYKLCNVLVAPTRAEGFGLPMAEAMLSGLPVITTAWSGQLDFCNAENSWLIDYEFGRADTHFNIMLSAWANPNISSLTGALIEAHVASPELRAKKAQAGRELLLDKFTWQDVAKRYVHSVEDIVTLDVVDKPRIGWLSTWGTKCGIATYSEHIINNIPSPDVVVFAPKVEEIDVSSEHGCIRNWNLGKDSNDLRGVFESVVEQSLNTVVIQFNYGFYNHLELSRFIDDCLDQSCVVVMMLHSTVDPVKELPVNNLQLMQRALSRCHRLLVHSIADLNRLKDIGLVDNVALFPHGVVRTKNLVPIAKVSTVPLVACYGFCLPHKGILELIEAIAILKDQGTEMRLRLINAEYPATESSDLVKRVRELIVELGLSDLVEFNSEYLSDRESLGLLSAADLIVFPYQQTGESASGAVRYGLATGRPVAVTPLSIFDDVSSAVFYLPGIDPAALAVGIASTINAMREESIEVKVVEASAKHWRDEFDYAAVGQRLYGICSALLNQKGIKEVRR